VIYERKEREIQIRFFHRIYCFYKTIDVENAKSLYSYHKNYDEFERSLVESGIEFTWDFNHNMVLVGS
jgi:hypothetical protein